MCIRDRHYIYYKNRRNLTDGIVELIDTKTNVIFKNLTDTIYNEINFINSKKFIDDIVDLNKSNQI